MRDNISQIYHHFLASAADVKEGCPSEASPFNLPGIKSAVCPLPNDLIDKY